MTSSEERVPILKDASQKKHSSSRIRFFVNLGIILLFFKGSESMLGSCYKQYLYAWSQQYLNNNNSDSDSNNVSKTTNTSESNGNTPDCGKDSQTKASEDKAQDLASQWEMYFEIYSGFLIFFSVSIYGTLSDYFGRRTFGCLALFGYATKGAILTAVIYFDLHIAFFFIAFGVDAFCGSSYMFSLYSYTSSADVTQTIRARVIGVSVIEMLIGVGALTTNIVNGYLIKYFGYFYSMLISTCGVYFSFFIAILLLKETKRSDDKTCVQIEKVKEKVHPSCKLLFSNYLSFYISKDQKGKKLFWLCLILFFLVELNLLNKSSVMTLYELGRPFCWDSERIGWYDGIYVAALYVITIILLKPMLRCVSETTIACLGIISAIAFNVVVGFASSSLDLYLSIVAGLFMVLPKCMIRGMVSSRVKGHRQGAIFASLQSSELVCKMISGSISLSIYSHTLDTMRGFVFLVFAGVSFINLLLSIWVRRLFQKEKREETITINTEKPALNT